MNLSEYCMVIYTCMDKYFDHIKISLILSNFSNNKSYIINPKFFDFTKMPESLIMKMVILRTRLKSRFPFMKLIEVSVSSFHETNETD